MSKTIGIVGSRRRNTANDNVLLLREFAKIYKEGDKIVSGGCPRGADNMAYILAKERGLSITIHFPKWEEQGKAAGFIRNTYIAQDCDVLLALVASDRTGGTEDTVKKALKLGKEVIYV